MKNITSNNNSDANSSNNNKNKIIITNNIISNNVKDTTSINKMHLFDDCSSACQASNYLRNRDINMDSLDAILCRINKFESKTAQEKYQILIKYDRLRDTQEKVHLMEQREIKFNQTMGIDKLGSAITPLHQEIIKLLRLVQDMVYFNSPMRRFGDWYQTLADIGALHLNTHQSATSGT